ncbi:MAG: fused MFS/spermidine synthase [Myxococcota bacterium]
MSRPLRIVIYSLFLLSGATALVYQVTWLRNLSLVFGASFEATSIVLASFMAGLSAGGFVFARRAERMRHALAVYGWIEIGIAAFALVVPALLAALDRFYVQAALASDAVTPGLQVLRVGMALAILFVPTFLMGGSLPVLTRGMVERYGDFGSRLSWLYGINTLGAVVGAVAAGFFLIPALGVWHSQLLAVAANTAIGVAAIAGNRAAERARASAASEPSEVPPPPPAEERRALVLVYWGTAVSGLCALALEVMWTRGISIAVGTTTYSFTVMLAAFLTGIWLGSWLHAVLPLRRVGLAVQFGLVLCVIGAASTLASFWIPRLPELVVPLNAELYGLEPRVRGATTLLIGFLVMLVPCIFMGVAFPLAGEARARLGVGFGRSAGEALGLNTLGSIAGSLLAGFVLIPSLGLQRGMLLVAALYSLYGCVVLVAALGRRALLPAGAFAALVVGVPVWVAPWDLAILGSFQSNQLPFYLRGEADVRSRTEGWTVLYYREGRVSTVSVVDQGWDRTLIVNGKAVASDDPVDGHIQLLLGHVPVIAHPDPKRVVVIGMGTGITLGSVTAHEGIEEVVLAEIEPAVLGARPWFARVNGDPLGDPRLEVAIQDGRNYLKTTSGRFDVITADPIHPFTRGSAYLYTTEYYRIALSRLNEGGVMCQWLPITDLSLEDARSVIGTFAGVFPNTTVWQSSHDVILIGSEGPLRFDLPDLGRRLSAPRVAAQLSRLGLDDPHVFLAELGMDDAGVRRFTEGAPKNTDDNLFLEFSTPMSMGAGQASVIARNVGRHRRLLEGSASFTLSGADASDRERLRQFRDAKSSMSMARLAANVLRDLRAVHRRHPDYRPVQIHLARALAQRGSAELEQRKPAAALQLAERATAVEAHQPSAHLLEGTALRALGRDEEAVRAIRRGIALRPDRWISHYQLAQALFALGRPDEARAALEEALALNPAHPLLREALAQADVAADGEA